MASNHRRGPWSEAEDSYLMSLVQTQGPLNWVRISTMLGSRTPKQCRERYHQNLKPSLNHDPITPEEGAQIEQLVNEIGKRWAEIARRLHGRSDNAVKNWWNGSQNRRKRLDRRKTAHHHQVPYGADERAEMEHYARANMSMAVPRTMPMPARPLPAPLRAASGNDNYYSVETPLSSPSAYSPQSELAPSLMSDWGSNYSTSPQAYNSRPPFNERPHLELPPLKMASMGAHASPRSSQSPTDNKLPPLSAMSLAPSSQSPYSTSPESIHTDPMYHHRPAPPMPLASPDYFTTRPCPPTASCSPSGLHLRPISADRDHSKSEDRSTRLHVADLLHN